MRLWVEKAYPYIGGVIAGALLASSLTLGAILTGFLATSKTILISLHGSGVMEKLKSSTYIKELISYLAEAIWLSFGFSLLVLLGFFLSNSSNYFFDVAWIAAGVMSAFAFIRVTNIILKIIRHNSA